MQLQETDPQKVVISSKAYAAIIAETYTHPENETGGILLGTNKEGVWYIFEVIDPGYQQVVRQRAYFEYDHVYITHLAHVYHRIYRQPIEIIGLWHRHPGSLDTFSSTDDVTNRRFADMREAGAISGIVNLDPDFRITLYHVSRSLTYTAIEDVVIGDEQIPPGFMRLKKKEELTQRRKKVVSVETDTGHERGGIFGRWFSKPKEQTSDIDIPFSMVEEEMDAYLDAQVDYAYSIRPRGNTLLVSLEYQGQMAEYPRRVEAVFFEKDGERYCEIDHIELPYRRGILKEYIHQAVAVYQEQLANEAASEQATGHSAAGEHRNSPGAGTRAEEGATVEQEEFQSNATSRAEEPGPAEDTDHSAHAERAAQAERATRREHTRHTRHTGHAENTERRQSTGRSEHISQDSRAADTETEIEWACGVLAIEWTELVQLGQQTALRRARDARVQMIKDYHPDKYASEGNDLLNQRANEETAKINRAYEVVVRSLRAGYPQRRVYER